MLAKDVMSTVVMTATADMSVRDVARKLLAADVSALPVVDADGRVVGIVSEGDLLHRAETGTERRRSWWLQLIDTPEDNAQEFVKTHARHVGDVMTRDVVTVPEDMPLAEIAMLLEHRRIKRVPVVRDGRMVGIVSRADLLRALASAPDRRVPTDGSDRNIREKLLACIDGKSWAPSMRINVVVEKGIVHLWGFVSSDSEAKALCVAAEEIEGVRGVETHLNRMPLMDA